MSDEKTDGNKLEEQKETAKEELESEWSGSGVAFIGVGLGATIVLTTLIIIAAISYGVVHDSGELINEILKLVK